MANWLDKYEQGGLVLKKKTKDNYGKRENPNDVKASVGPDFIGLGYNTKGRNYSPAWGGQFAMGGALPGATGMMYARTQDPAPSNGKYAKKTKASAQNGSVIKDDRGQWDHPGEITEIGSNNITMQGVDYPVLGVSDTGDTKMMQPGKDYKFKGKKVTEYPMAQDGKWLSKYDNISNTSSLKKQAEETIAKRNNNRPTLSQYTPKQGEQERWNAEKSARNTEENALLNRLAANPHMTKAMDNVLEPMLAIEAGIGGGKLLKAGAKAAGKYLTEETALKNAYKINPFAFKPNSESYYRMLGDDGISDALEQGVLRPAPNTNNWTMSTINNRANKVWFNKGSPMTTKYNPNLVVGYKGPGMAEYSGKLAESPGGGSHLWDRIYGYGENNIPLYDSNVKLYKEDWLKGYKEVPRKQYK